MKESKDSQNDGGNDSDWIEATKITGYLMAAGINLAVGVVVGVLSGLWLDRKLGTVWLFTLVLTLVGFTGGIAMTIKAVKRLEH